ncbi:hypothetical protein IRJ41_012297 [Triplophysa rosa]|uniref:Uncharacterized protein n=1 Tax=Triplophysa rosa TaxID=992332 RepID=A0A9W7WFC1_TRIRA|nr:hypothetical protein IRJ41_012297 [Triplophysa rosa]
MKLSVAWVTYPHELDQSGFTGKHLLEGYCTSPCPPHSVFIYQVQAKSNNYNHRSGHRKNFNGRVTRVLLREKNVSQLKMDALKPREPAACFTDFNTCAHP